METGRGLSGRDRRDLRYRAAHASAGAPPYDAFLKSHGAGASALTVVARPKCHHLYDDALVARYLKLEDDVAKGRFS